MQIMFHIELTSSLFPYRKGPSVCPIIVLLSMICVLEEYPRVPMIQHNPTHGMPLCVVLGHQDELPSLQDQECFTVGARAGQEAKVGRQERLTGHESPQTWE